MRDPHQCLTYEREGCRQREEHAVAVHGEGDNKVHGQTPQQEEGVDRRPVWHLQPQLRSQTHKKKTQHNIALNKSRQGPETGWCTRREVDCWPECWRWRGGTSAWGGQRTGSRQRLSHHPSLCRTGRHKGRRRAPGSSSRCEGRTWRRPSCWSTGWVGRAGRAVDAGNSTRRWHPGQQGETETVMWKWR